MNKKLVNVLVLISAIVIFFLIAEGLTRIFIEYPEHQEIGWHIPSENPILNYELTPNKEGIFYGYPAYVNDYARRDNHNTNNFEGKEIFAFVGDSMTFGRGVSQNGTLPIQFEKIYNSQSQKKIAALNFGIIAYNLEQEVELIKSKVLDYDVSKIFVVYYLNDLRPKENILLENDKAIKLPLHLKIYNFFISNSRFLFFLKTKLSAVLYNKSYLTYYDEMYANNSSSWISFKNNLSELSKIQKQKNVEIYYVIYPHVTLFNDNHPYQHLYEKVEIHAKESGLEVINLLDAFKNQDATKLRANIYDSHPNAQANEIAAQYLLYKIK